MKRVSSEGKRRSGGGGGGGGEEGTLANPEKLIPPCVKWQFQFCQQTSLATMLPEEAAEGEHTHTHTPTHSYKDKEYRTLEQRRSKSLIIPLTWHYILFSPKMKADKSGELLTLNYWGCVSATSQAGCHHPWTTLWRLLPIKGNQMSGFQSGVVLQNKMEIGFRYCFAASKHPNKFHVFDVADQCLSCWRPLRLCTLEYMMSFLDCAIQHSQCTLSMDEIYQEKTSGCCV